MSTLQITPSIGSVLVEAMPHARETRDTLLAKAALVLSVKDRIDADDATGTLRELKEFTKGIETARAEAKAPALELGKKIDALAKELAAQTDAEATRLSRLIGAFEQEERRKAEEIQYRATLEAQRIAREAEQAAIDARRTATTAEAADRASDAVVEQAQAKIVEVRQVAANAVVAKPTGTGLRQDVCFEVTDIAELYRTNPTLVNLEPNGTAIRAILRSNPNLQIPGLRHWRESKLSIKS